MGRFRTDYERLEMVKKFKASKKTIAEFVRENDVSYTTMRDWIRAYDNIDGSFVKLQKEVGRPGVVLSNSDCNIKMLKNDEMYAKNSHFTRFDHSVVKIEFECIKITTSLEQALKIMEQYYDRHQKY